MDDTGKRKELTEKDRYVIEKCLKHGDSKAVIASLLGVSLRTINREVNRGTVAQLDTELRKHYVYKAHYAHNLHCERVSKRGRPSSHSKRGELLAHIKEKMSKKWSPDAIIGRLRLQGEDTVCTKTVYNWLNCGYIKGYEPPPKQHKKKPSSRVGRNNSTARRIDERPLEATNRQPCHWEMDLVLSGHKGSGCLLVFTERASRYELMYLLKDKKQTSVLKVFERLERHYKGEFKSVFKTITCDNGSEFLDSSALERSSVSEGNRTEIYYAHPYSSWERGSNENANKLIRKFIKKGEDISKLPVAYIKRIERWINTYPRRIFGYKTADEIRASQIA
jgi:IS30 family transposase